jgi:hypothetical protein
LVVKCFVAPLVDGQGKEASSFERAAGQADGGSAVVDGSQGWGKGSAVMNADPRAFHGLVGTPVGRESVAIVFNVVSGDFLAARSMAREETQE